LPAEVHRHIAPHLIRCGGRTLAHSDSSAWTSYAYRNHEGKDDLLKQNLSFLWYPWAVEACSAWLEHARKSGGDEDEVRKVRRVLGWLVVELAEGVPHQGVTWAFVAAERLYALGHIPRP
jgi:hypothetical protein